MHLLTGLCNQDGWNRKLGVSDVTTKSKVFNVIALADKNIHGFCDVVVICGNDIKDNFKNENGCGNEMAWIFDIKKIRYMNKLIFEMNGKVRITLAYFHDCHKHNIARDQRYFRSYVCADSFKFSFGKLVEAAFQ